MTKNEAHSGTDAVEGGPVDSGRRQIERLYLSGGSNRAALGAVGAIAYLIHAGHWKDVEEVVSVSGGSLLNGMLAAYYEEISGDDAHDDDDEETFDALKTFVERLEADRLVPWATWRRLLISLIVVAGLIALVWLMLAATGVVGPARLSDAPWSVLAALGSPFLLLRTIRWGSGRYTADYAANLAQCPGVMLEEMETRRLHVICATGLSEGKPYYFFIGGAKEHKPEPSWGRVIDADYALQEAMAASASLPGASTVKAPEHDKQYGIRETLIDGGSSGNFGQQFNEPLERRWTQKARDYADGQREDVPDRVLIKRELGVDAGFPMKPESVLGRFLGRHSYLARLVRWLQVSNEAVYANDLTDFERDRLVQLCSWAHVDRVGNVRDDVGRQNLAGRRSPGERRLDDLRRRTARVPKFRPSPLQVAEAITTGVLATMSTLSEPDEQVLDPPEAVEATLEEIGQSLGLGQRLIDAWRSGGRTAFFELQPAPFAISHGGLGQEATKEDKAIERLSREAYVMAVKEGFTCLQVDVEVGIVDGRTTLVSDHSGFGRGRARKVSDLKAHPTLQSLLDDHERFPVPDPVTGGGVFWNIEIKSKRGEDQLCAILEKEDEANRLHRISISSPFQRRMLNRLREKYPELATNESLTEGALFGYNLLWHKDVDRAAGVQLPKRFGLKRGIVDRKRKQGRYVQAWVAETEKESYDLRRHGVSGVIADDPLLAKRAAATAAKGPLLEHPRISLFEETATSWDADQGTILLATASPRELAPIQAGPEFQAIHAVVDETGPTWAVHELSHATNASLQAAIRRTKPTILHIAGRGSVYQGILLEDEYDAADGISVSGLVDALDDGCKLVVLSAANADQLAAELADRGISTVSLSADVTDRAARGLAGPLYRALLSGHVANLEDVVAITARSTDPIKLHDERRKIPSHVRGPDPVVRRRVIGGPMDEVDVEETDGIGLNEREGVWWTFNGVAQRSAHSLAAPPVGRKSFTVAAWVRREMPSRGRQWFADTRIEGGVGGDTHGWLFGFLGSGELLFSLSGTENDWSTHWERSDYVDWRGNKTDEKHLRPSVNAYRNPTTIIRDDDWHLVAARVRFDFAPAERGFPSVTEVTLFIDGEIASGPWKPRRPWAGGVTGHSLLIGTGSDNKYSPQSFDGDVSDLGVVYRDLSDEEIRRLAEAGPQSEEAHAEWTARTTSSANA